MHVLCPAVGGEIELKQEEVWRELASCLSKLQAETIHNLWVLIGKDCRPVETLSLSSERRKTLSPSGISQLSLNLSIGGSVPGSSTETP